jgi:acyl-CoA thioesterase I
VSLRRLAAGSAAALVMLAVVPARAGHEARRCSAPEELTRFRATLPNTARAIRQGPKLVIVAIGSSSTEGVGASDPAHAYPAVLADELRRRWPHLSVTVINKGIGGELVSAVLGRFERDVLAYQPHLVIWQTGSHAALGTGDVEGYVAAIQEGIRRLKAARLDIVLMDPQFAPRVLARPLHARVVDAIGAAADNMKVATFRRFAVMQHWISSGQYRMDEVVSRDGLHLNDVSYGCIARLLADSLAIAAQLAPPSDTGISAAEALPLETRE